MAIKEYDVLIVGSGHSGGMAAKVLTQKGISCLMLNAGPEADYAQDRTAKAAQLGHEDEKFAYVAVTRHPGEPAEARVLRHPQIRPGHVMLELCTTDGRRLETVSRREGERYRQARKLDWGSPFAGPSRSR